MHGKVYMTGKGLTGSDHDVVEFVQIPNPPSRCPLFFTKRLNFEKCYIKSVILIPVELLSVISISMSVKLFIL